MFGGCKFVRSSLFVAMAMTVLSLLPLSAEGSDLSKFLRELFSDMSGREPTGSELNYHAELNRQGGSLDNAIVLFSSDEVYATQSHGDPNLYVNRMFQTFLGREPRLDEQTFWVSQMQNPGNRRVDLVRWFCQSNHVTQLPSFLPSPPAYYPPTSGSDIASQLVERTNLLVNFLKAELGQTYYGNQVLEDGYRLFALTKQYRNVVRSADSTQQQVQIVIGNMDKALQDLERGYYRVPGSSSQSKQMLHQVSQLVAAAQNSNAGWGPPPGMDRPPLYPRPPRPSIPDVATLEINRLVEQTRDFSYGLLPYQYYGPPYESLSRDVQGFATQVEALALMARQGQPLSEMQRSIWSLLDQARHISDDVSQTNSSIQRGWWNLQTQLRSTARSLGVNSDFNVQPSRPVVIDRPAWVGFPYQPSPNQPPAYQNDCIVLTDQLIGKIDRYSETLSNLSRINPNANSLLRSLQDFKHNVLIFRQSAAGGSFSTSLSSASDRLMSQYSELAREVTRVVSREPTLNSPLFYQIGESVQAIQRASRGI